MVSPHFWGQFVSRMPPKDQQFYLILCTTLLVTLQQLLLNNGSKSYNLLPIQTTQFCFLLTRSSLTCFLIWLCFWIHFFNVDFGKPKYLEASLRKHFRSRALSVRSSFPARVHTHLTVFAKRGLASWLELRCTNTVCDHTVTERLFPQKMRGLFMTNITFLVHLAFKFLVCSVSSVTEHSKSIKPWSMNELPNRQSQSTMLSWVWTCYCYLVGNVRAVVWNFCVPPFLEIT